MDNKNTKKKLELDCPSYKVPHYVKQYERGELDCTFEDIKEIILNNSRNLKNFHTFPIAFRSDFDIVLSRMKTHEQDFFCISDELKDNRAVVFEALTFSNEYDEDYAPSKLIINYKLASERLQKDKDVVRHFVKKCGTAIHVIDKKMLNDPEIFQDALTRTIEVYDYVNDSLRNNKECFIRNVLPNLDTIFTFCTQFSSLPKAIKEDKKIMLEVVKRYPILYKHLPDGLKRDADMVGRFISTKNRVNFQDIPEELLKDESFVRHCIKKNERFVNFLPVTLFSDKQKVIEIVRANDRVLKFLPARWLNDEDVMLQACIISGWNLEYASERLKNDPKIVKEAVRNDTYSLKFSSKQLVDDPLFLQELKQEVRDTRFLFSITKWKTMEEHEKEFQLRKKRKLNDHAQEMVSAN